MNSDRHARIHALHTRILSCRLCQRHFGFTPRPYVWGSADALIMQISQAPSLSVHHSGRPFDDVSGKRLRQWYGVREDVFYDKHIFYITSIAHCYPGKTSKGTDRRPPIRCARLWLEREMQLVENKLYIIVGAVAAKYFFPQDDFTSLVFDKDLTIGGRPVIVLPHPSPTNWRWLANHPDFFNIRLPYIRQIIRDVINSK